MSWRDRLNCDEAVKYPVAVSANSAESPVASPIGTFGTIGIETSSERTSTNAAPERDGIAAAIPSDRGWWCDFYEERTAHREFDGARPRADAERLAWGDAQWRWHKAHGERVSRELCAGCRRPVGPEPALDLIDGNRVHDHAGNDCLIRHGERWRGAAIRALVAMGLQPPEPEDAL